MEEIKMSIDRRFFHFFFHKGPLKSTHTIANRVRRHILKEENVIGFYPLQSQSKYQSG